MSSTISGWRFDRQSHQRVLAIAIPAIVANSSAPIVGLVDTWAIGHLPGAVHLAAVGLGGVIFNYLLWAFGFLRMGTTGLVAQAHGRGNKHELASTIAQASGLALLCGALMVALQKPILYLALEIMAAPPGVAEVTRDYFNIRIWAAPATLMVYVLTGVLFGQGRGGAVLALQLVLNLGNGALNLLFVIGFEMGVPGVALGTLLAQWLAALFGLWLLAGNPGGALLLAVSRSTGTWTLAAIKRLMMINSYLFFRTILLMTALTLVMREAAGLGEVSMAVTHVINQYVMLIALGLDGFAHAAEALAGAAWGDRKLAAFKHWVRLAGLWAAVTSVLYAAAFWLGGDWLTALLTNLPEVRENVHLLMPVLIAMPLVSVWCFHFDGVFIGATAARAMLVTMAVAFVIYLLLLQPFTRAWGLAGLWSAVLVFMAVRGLGQYLWYPRLLRQLARHGS
jgi:MATE family multidrug resistance protein